MSVTVQHLQDVHTFNDLAALLHDELGWPSSEWTAFEGVLSAYNIAAEAAPGVDYVGAVRRFSEDQPFDLFIVEFGSRDADRGAIREIAKRVSGRGDTHSHTAYDVSRLLFLSRSLSGRCFAFYCLSKPRIGQLRVRDFGWTDQVGGTLGVLDRLGHFAWSRAQSWREAFEPTKVTDRLLFEFEDQLRAIADDAGKSRDCLAEVLEVALTRGAEAYRRCEFSEADAIRVIASQAKAIEGLLLEVEERVADLAQSLGLDNEEPGPPTRPVVPGLPPEILRSAEELGVFLCRGTGGASARAIYTPPGMRVLQGSVARRDAARSLQYNYRKNRDELVRKGVLADDGEFLRFTVDHDFSSPSAAAVIVLGRSANGWDEWRRAPDGLSLGSLTRCYQDGASGD